MTPDQEADYRQYVTGQMERLQRFAYLSCGDWQRAEDAVQDSLVKLYVAWPRAVKSSLDAYARRIVVNCLIDQHRRVWFRRVRTTGEVPDRARADPHEDATAERMRVLVALRQLSPRQRITVVLRYWEDRPIDEVAQIMRCSTGTVKSQTARGLQALRGLLAETVAESSQGVS